MGGMGGGRPACALHLEILVGNPSVVCRSPSIRLNDGHGPPKRSGCHGEECRPTAYTARGGGGARSPSRYGGVATRQRWRIGRRPPLILPGGGIRGGPGTVKRLERTRSKQPSRLGGGPWGPIGGAGVLGAGQGATVGTGWHLRRGGGGSAGKVGAEHRHPISCRALVVWTERSGRSGLRDMVSLATWRIIQV